MEQRLRRVPDDNFVMSAPAIDHLWSLSGAAVLEPWRRRVRGELPIEPRYRPGPTTSELSLWDALSDRDQGWRREYATGRYRLDFYLPSHKLAVEVDGSSHDGPVRRAADNQRDLWHLERFGIATARYSVDEVMRDRAGVLADIDGRIAALSMSSAVDGEHVMAESGELPVPVAETEVEVLAVANARVEAEISSYMGVACATILPVFEPRGPWTRLLNTLAR
jgi:very-short-patch-repair endonuclease